MIARVAFVIAAACVWMRMTDLASAEEPPPSAPIDLKTMLEHAKETVFPALVFVKPIIEDYEAGEKQKHQVFGSGVIISPEGLVVTNNHVVEKAIQVRCVLFNKEQVEAEVAGRDPDTDLALLRLKVGAAMLPLPYGEFADSDILTEGDFVVALGSPFGFTRSMSLGIISNRQRYLGFETEHRYNTWIQTDAAINPGNSGGPLVDTRGRIVGINTLGIFLADGIGFSVPSNVAKRVADKLKTDGEVKRAWSGLRLQPLKDFFTDTFTDAPSGVLIAGVEKGSPGEAAGIQKGDVLLSSNGVLLQGTYAEDLPSIEWTLAELPVGMPVPLKILRGKEEIAGTMVLTPKGKVEGDSFDCRRWNMAVKEINQYKDPDLHFYRNEGVYVLSIRYPGNALQAGLKQHDIITSIDRAPVKTLADAKQIYERIVGDASREKRVLVEAIRNGYSQLFTVDYTRDYDKVE